LPWDYWGLTRDFSPRRPPTDIESQTLDAIAEVIAVDPPAWPDPLEIYIANPDVRLTHRIISGREEPAEISLEAFLVA
jgi:hypothetical protein